MTITLNNLSKITTSSKRVGRGGKFAKNAGKGHKGQQKRAGKTRIGFEGGQQSILKRTPKFRGYNFKAKTKRNLAVLSLTVLSKNFQDGEEVNLASLQAKSIVSPFIKSVRVINSGTLSKKLVFGSDIYITKSLRK